MSQLCVWPQWQPVTCDQTAARWPERALATFSHYVVTAWTRPAHASQCDHVTSPSPAADRASERARRTPDWAAPVLAHPWAQAAALSIVLPVLSLRLGGTAELPAYWYLGVLAVVLSTIDIALHRLPDALTLPSHPVAAGLLAVAVPFTPDGGARYLDALTGAVALFALFAVQWVIVPNALGLGDVKLAGVLGLYLGWLGAPAWALGLMAMYALGGLYAIFMLLTRRAQRGALMAFGPFMLVGTLLSITVHAGG